MAAMGRAARCCRDAALHLLAVWFVLAVAAVPAMAATGAAAAGFPDTTSGIHLWAPMHEPGGRFASQAEAVAAARRFDLITIRPGQLDGYLPAMRAANPDLRVYVYINGSYLYRSDFGKLPLWAMAHTLSGDLIQSNGWGNYLGKPSNPAWIAYKQQECAAAIAASGADGCYLDMLGTAPTIPGYGSGLPVDPSTGLLWTKRDWLTDTAALASAVASSSGTPVLGNGFGNGRRYFNWRAPSRILLSGALGSTAEGWMKMPRTSAGTFENVLQWKQDVDLLADANAAGGVALTMTKMWGGGDDQQVAAWRLFALASFLLGNSGHSYFYFSAAPADPATLDSPLYHLPIGRPAGPYVQTGAVYQRWFSNGRVLVNPGTTPVSVPLGGSYRTPAGGLISTLALPPHSGQILTLP
jgi:hypothetical protein